MPENATAPPRPMMLLSLSYRWTGIVERCQNSLSDTNPISVKMKFNQLRDVVAIAERGSLCAAARHLALAQPALTRSVHELERELGVPLFERRARGMILTPMGEAFVRRARWEEDTTETQ